MPEPLLSQLKLGTRIGFQCDGCKTTYATITYISPQAEYTPPVIYSRESRGKLVYRVECKMPSEVAVKFHPGQPVDVFLKQN